MRIALDVLLPGSNESILRLLRSGDIEEDGDEVNDKAVV